MRRCVVRTESLVFRGLLPTFVSETASVPDCSQQPRLALTASPRPVVSPSLQRLRAVSAAVSFPGHCLSSIQYPPVALRSPAPHHYSPRCCSRRCHCHLFPSDRCEDTHPPLNYPIRPCLLGSHVNSFSIATWLSASKSPWR